MNYSEASLLADIDRIRQIPIIATMLEVICRSTGMGFAAVARVTDDRWIAGSVRDEISFGLKPGGELPVKTTICSEIQGSHKPVIIDNVDEDQIYCDHHTPATYGFKSYISFPIFLKDGTFFGTLCAIDPRPATLKDPKTIGMFNLFTDLISFHLQSLQIVEESKQVVQDLNHQLVDSIHINRQFNFISNHNLQEPLRKMRIFSGMLITAAESGDVRKVKDYAVKVDNCAQTFSSIVNELSEFSEGYNETSFELTDLNAILDIVIEKLDATLEAAGTRVILENLPAIIANPVQMERLFRDLIINSVKNAKESSLHQIRIYSGNADRRLSQAISKNAEPGFVEIIFEDSGSALSALQIEKMFDVFSNFPDRAEPKADGTSLAFCRKIVRNHGGSISASSEPDRGTVFSILLPAKVAANAIS